MDTIADLFTTAAGDDAAVTADQTKLSADTAAAVSAHTGLTSAVVANGPTVVPGLTPGTFVVLLPQPDGTVTNVVAKDGTQPAAAPAPASGS